MTGAAGFIGSHLCERLLRIGFEVHGLDNLSRGSAEKIEALRRNGLHFHRVDVRDRYEVERILREVKPDIVMHLAALISVEESFEKPELYMEVNAVGTKNIVEGANKAGSRRLIYASSAAVYGNPIKLPISEDHPLKPISPYGLSKLAGEVHIRSRFTGEENSVILRIFNVYGPGQSLEYAGVIAKFLNHLRMKKPPTIFGDGSQTRDFIHVHDVVEAFIRSLDAKLDNHEVINIASGKPTRIIDLAETMINLFGLDLKPVHQPLRQGDIQESYADISRARRILGWNPSITLKEGLRSLIESS